MKRAFYLVALLLALESGTSYAQTAVDNLCKAKGDSARITAKERDKGTPIGNLLETIDEVWETNHEMAPELRTAAIKEDKERTRAIYAHPELSPTQEWHAAVKACHAANGIKD